MPRYQGNPLITEFSMLCPGISQNSKHHHLTSYKGHVWRENSYLEICNHNILNITHDVSSNFQSSYMNNGQLILPPSHIWYWYGHFEDRFLNGVYDMEILDSFSQVTHSTFIIWQTVSSLDLDGLDWNELPNSEIYHLAIGGLVCVSRIANQCVPPHSYQCVKLETLICNSIHYLIFF